MPPSEFDSLVRALVELVIGVLTTMPAWISAVAAMLTFVIAGVALWYAHGQIVESRQNRALTQYLDTERSQPYVVVYAEPSDVNPLFIDLVVKNYGPTAAHDVRIEIDPWPVRSWPDVGSRVEIPTAIAILAPGQEWRTSWDSTRHRKDTELPDRHIGMVRYLGLQARHLESPIVLDWAVYKSRRWMEVLGMHDAATALREIKTILKGWNEGGNVSMLVRDGDAVDAKRRADREEWRRQRDEAKARSGG